MPRNLLFTFVFCCFAMALSASAPVHAQQTAETKSDQALRALVDEVWNWELSIDPWLSTDVGAPTGQDRLPDDRPETLASHDLQRAAFLERLHTIALDSLTPSSQIDYQVLELRLSNQRNEYRFGNHLMPISNRAGYHVLFPELPTTMRLESEADYQNYVSRLKDFHRYSQEQIALMREGLAQGKTMPAIILRGAPDQIKAHVVDDAKTSLLFGPFTKSKPSSITDTHWQSLSDSALEAIETSVIPAYRELLTFMQTDYLPQCRSTISASALPDGRDFYRYRVKSFTT